MAENHDLNAPRFDIPDMAAGKIVPPVVFSLELEEELRQKAERKSTLYFILGLVGTFTGTILGWLLGKYF